MPKVTPQNDDLQTQLDAVYQRRYDNAFAWSRAVSMFQALPGLRGFWPMSAVGYSNTDRARDLSGNDSHLTKNGAGDIQFGYTGLIPFVSLLSASTQYLSRADGGAANWADLTGTEAYILAGMKGITHGGWFYHYGAAAADEYYTAKVNAYYVRRLNTGVIRGVYVDGTPTFHAVDSTATIGAGEWVFAVSRFVPSTSNDLWVNGIKYTNAAGIIASVRDTADDFRIGYGAGAGPLNGRCSLGFLCAAALSDTIINTLYSLTRPLFGIR